MEFRFRFLTFFHPSTTAPSSDVFSLFFNTARNASAQHRFSCLISCWSTSSRRNEICHTATRDRIIKFNIRRLHCHVYGSTGGTLPPLVSIIFSRLFWVKSFVNCAAHFFALFDLSQGILDMFLSWWGLRLVYTYLLLSNNNDNCLEIIILGIFDDVFIRLSRYLQLAKSINEYHKNINRILNTFFICIICSYEVYKMYSVW